MAGMGPVSFALSLSWGFFALAHALPGIRRYASVRSSLALGWDGWSGLLVHLSVQYRPFMGISIWRGECDDYHLVV